MSLVRSSRRILRSTRFTRGMTPRLSGMDSVITLSPLSLTLSLLGAAVTGYIVSRQRFFNTHSHTHRTRQVRKTHSKSWPNSYDVQIHPDSSEEELMKSLNTPAQRSDNKARQDDSSDSSSSEESGPGDLQAFSAVPGECKLVLVVRTDLGMSRGKIAAQCSHATLACFTKLQSIPALSSLLRRWRSTGQAKVAVQCKDEGELSILQAQAMSLGLCARVIHDAGRTQIAAGSATVLGVGPGPKSIVDQVTGHLKLL